MLMTSGRQMLCRNVECYCYFSSSKLRSRWFGTNTKAKHGWRLVMWKSSNLLVTTHSEMYSLILMYFWWESHEVQTPNYLRGLWKLTSIFNQSHIFLHFTWINFWRKKELAFLIFILISAPKNKMQQLPKKNLKTKPEIGRRCEEALNQTKCSFFIKGII